MRRILLFLLLLAPLPILAAEPDLNPSVSLAACDCQRAANGLCERWGAGSLNWQLFAPGDTGKDIANVDVEMKVVQALATWQNVKCKVCTLPGNLPTAPTGTDTLGCVAVPCDENPLGVNLEYRGQTTTPLLASTCWQKEGPCDGSAANTNQIAFLRDDTLWPMSKLQVTSSFLTVNKDGEILDADILIRDTTHVFCISQCAPSTYDLQAALVFELGHALGLGKNSDSAAISQDNLPTSNDLSRSIDAKLQTCACVAYRFSGNLGQCVGTDAPLSCDAGPLRPLPSRHSKWPYLLVILVGLVGWRVWTRRNG